MDASIPARKNLPAGTASFFAGSFPAVNLAAKNSHDFLPSRKFQAPADAALSSL